MDNYEKYIGHVFDKRYKIESLIGIGGMAVVYKATDLLMRRLVAVKILRDDIAADEASVQRFINESKAVAMLSHQNIVNIYDVSVRNNIKYIVMEFIEGITLKNYISHKGTLTFKEVLGFSFQILRALNHAHKKGIVHRDIKPQNIMLLKDGVIKVMDFGIAKLPNADTVTSSDKAIGTVYYVSPEQASGEKIDSRSDIYSLGAVMYEMATGKLPFDADATLSIALMQINDTPTMPRAVNPKIPVGLEQIIMKAMEKDPASRYQSAEQMIECLEQLKKNPSIVFKPTLGEKVKHFFHKKTPQGKQSKSMLPVILGVFLAFIITFGVCGVYIFSGVLGKSSIHDYETISVESFVGISYSDTLDKWFSSSIYYKLAKIEYKYDDEITPGVIISQSPKAGDKKKVLPGKQLCDITLVISSGEETLHLSDYSFMDYRLAVSDLRKNHVNSNIVKEDSAYEYGIVIRTEPEAFTDLKSGDTVTIVISNGFNSLMIEVPDFKGQKESAVLLKLFESGLRIGKIKYVRSSKDEGTIISQSINKGAKVAKFTSVDFTVSGGKRYGLPGKDTEKETKSTETAKETKLPETDTMTVTETLIDLTETVTESEDTSNDTSDFSDESSTGPISSETDTSNESSPETLPDNPVDPTA